ncbi:HAD family hydrolase [Parvibium lacunae]|uniref:HAD family hydrolase n=2 Tax=Parvibium lacunae TaxID=1888893 RepID=A0A368L1C3_9BURK|nr:HAD family hydrolase [Parvibium lacunae]
MNLALFDLDNTLIPFDSDHGWGSFLANLGVVDKAEYERRNDAFYADYKAGCLDMNAYLEFQLGALTRFPRAQLNAWHAEFMRSQVLPNLRPTALELVQAHQAAGDLCCVVTATNRFVTGPIVAAFGITHLIATEPEQVNGQFTGKVQGIPSFREGKITRVQDWLSALGYQWDSFARSTFYSDSMNDLPLLEKVSDPVATNPDAKLQAVAQTRGWRILNLFA